MYLSIPDRLVDLAKGRNVVPFIGAGVSKFVDPDQYPTWSEFIAEMITSARRDQHINEATYNDLIVLNDFGKSLTVAQELRDKLPTDYFHEFFYRRFGELASTPPDYGIYNLLFKIDSPVLVTSNYDRLVEDAYAHIFRRNMNVATHESSINLVRALQNRDRATVATLFKIHGDVQSMDSIVISERDYRRVMYEMPDYRMALGSIFTYYTILFIGFSMRDKEMITNIEHLRHTFKYSNRPHYILLREGSLTETERGRWRNDFGLETLYYQGDESHMGLKTWLEDFIDLLEEVGSEELEKKSEI